MGMQEAEPFVPLVHILHGCNVMITNINILETSCKHDEQPSKQK